MFKNRFINLISAIILAAVLLLTLYWTLPVNAYIPPDFEFPFGYMGEQVLAPKISKPLGLAINSTGTILLTGHDEGDIYQLHYDGSVSTWNSLGSYHTALDFDGADNLYVSAENDLWMIEPDGSTTFIASGISPYQLAVDPISGDIFAVGNLNDEILRITPQGQVSIYATGFTEVKDVDIDPLTGDVYAVDWTQFDIIKIESNGTWSVFSPGTEYGGFIAFSPDGALYTGGGDGYLREVSMIDGTRSMVPFTDPANGQNCGMTASLIEFMPDGRLISADYTQGDVVILDLEAETYEVLIQGLTNTGSIAMEPTNQDVYLGLPSIVCDQPGKILRINDDKTASVVIDDLPNSVNAITFSSTGEGYASTGGQIYTFTLTGTSKLYITEHIGPQSLAVHPSTEVLWGANRDYYWEDALDGTIITHTYPITQVHNGPKITFTPDGNLYFFGCEDKSLDEPDPGIYHVDTGTNIFTEILDLSGTKDACNVGAFTGAADGHIYWLLSELLRISQSGDSQVWAVIPGGDPLGIINDPVSNDIYFGNGAGVFRIFEAENIYLPLMVK